MQLLQNSWSKEINPLLRNQLNNGFLLENIEIQTGVNTINHLLGRMQQGYFIVDQDAPASMYRSQPLNKQTLTLTSTGPCTIKLWVF